MATTLLDQIRISSAVRQSAKYRTSETAEWVIALKGRTDATMARIVVLIDGTETEVDTANRNTRTLRFIHQILTKENWEGRSAREQVLHALQRVNKWLYDQAVDAHKVGRLGASIMVAIFTDREGMTVDLLYAGNCRAVLIRAGESYPLTVAHTRSADFASKTGLPSTGSDQSPTRFLGAAPTLEVDTKVKVPGAGGGQATDGSQFKLALRDRLLLCSVLVTPVAVEHFLPHMPTSSNSTIAQELVNYRGEPPVGNATAVVIARKGVTRRLPYGLIVIVVLALAVLFFWRQFSQPSAEAWPQLAQMLGLQTPTPTATASLEPPSMPITTAVAMSTTVPLTATVTATTVPPAPETQTATAVPTASPIRTATATQTAPATPIVTATATITGLSTVVTMTPTNTPRPTATSTNTPVVTATPTYTPAAQPVASPTETPTLTPTGVTTAALKPGPQPLELADGEHSRPEGAKGEITFKWSATRDVNTNEVYHFEIIDPNNGGRVVHSNDPVLRQLAEEDDRVAISVLQGKDWLSWHVRTGVIEDDGKFRATSEWSKEVRFKVTVKTEDNNSSKPTPLPTPR